MCERLECNRKFDGCQLGYRESWSVKSFNENIRKSSAKSGKTVASGYYCKENVLNEKIKKKTSNKWKGYETAHEAGNFVDNVQRI